MNNYGTMDGWHGDEHLCVGDGCFCSDCEDKYYFAADDDSWRDEEAA